MIYMMQGDNSLPRFADVNRNKEQQKARYVQGLAMMSWNRVQERHENGKLYLTYCRTQHAKCWGREMNPDNGESIKDDTM